MNAAPPDPFDSFTDLLAADERDPYPRLAELRALAPVLPGNFTLDAEPAARPRAGTPGMYVVLGYEEALAVLRDAAGFHSAGYEHTIGRVMGRTIIMMDGEEHTANRALVSHAFRPNALARWEQELIGPVVNELVDAFEPRGRAELVRELTFRFPVLVIARILGLPREDTGWFQQLSTELISGALLGTAQRASEEMRTYFLRLIEQRRAVPADDVISDLVHGDVDGERLDDEAICSFLRLLLPAGVETTYRSSGNLLFHLLHNPEQMEAVRADRSLLPQAIEEGLRHEPPLHIMMRQATRDAVIGDEPIAGGSMLTIAIGAANHDGRRWDDPERFDIFRPQRPHLAFANGAHICLGLHLARLETKVAMNCVLDRLARLRLDPDAEPPRLRGTLFRCPTALPVVFEAQHN